MGNTKRPSGGEDAVVRHIHQRGPMIDVSKQMAEHMLACDFLLIAVEEINGAPFHHIYRSGLTHEDLTSICASVLRMVEEQEGEGMNDGGPS